LGGGWPVRCPSAARSGGPGGTNRRSNRVRLSEKAARRIAREASVQGSQRAAEAINEYWNTAYHPKQIQRYADQIGQHFREHKQQIKYPRYRANGWPISSAPTESGVKRFNKRTEGSEQFWSTAGAEAIQRLRSMRLSQDGRWLRAWNQGHPLRATA
jgi:hypothetical protein